tara:strand:+ start:277 stop:564 length:288 start_codon:yes stop_codon:yes gene_type:complete
MTYPINNAKLKELAYSTLPQSKSGGVVSDVLQEAFNRLEKLREEPGCNCKKGNRRRKIYSDIMARLAAAEDIQPLKDFLGVKEVSFTLSTGNVER